MPALPEKCLVGAMRRATNRLRQALAKPKRVYQTRHRDEFGEVPARKREAMRLAHLHGHQMGPWHKRPNDDYGRWNSFCIDCNAGMVVCTECPERVDAIYGPALDEFHCGCREE